ncbi:MAG TPA: hypothetical protein PK156_03575 [Polyangium sp.]|nr:hypothetical protein [Polyangium sp.]
MGRTATDSLLETAKTSSLTWAALLGLVAACGACSSAGECRTDELPPTDPCYQKGCCEMVPLNPDGGVAEDAGTEVPMRMCGACNG